MKHFTEELDELQPLMNKTAAATAAQTSESATRAPESTQTAVPAASAPAPAATFVDADDEFDASAYSNTLQKLKVPTGAIARFAVLGPVAEGFRHYDKDGKVYYACVSKRDPKRPVIIEKAQCCTLWDEAKYYRAALVIHYTGADPKSGKLNGNNNWQLAALVVAGLGWGQIKNLLPEGMKVGDIDFKALPRPNGYGLEFAVQAPAAAWKKASPELQASVMAEVERLKAQLPAKLGKMLTPFQLKALAGPARSGGDVDTLDELGD